MHASLARLAGLPAATRVYFGHEYTASNLRFAAAADAANPAVTRRAAAVAALGGHSSTPSTIGEEQATNPFLRVAEPAVVATARQAEPDLAATGRVVRLDQLDAPRITPDERAAQLATRRAGYLRRLPEVQA